MISQERFSVYIHFKIDKKCLEGRLQGALS